MLTIGRPARGWLCAAKSCKNPPQRRFSTMGKGRGWVLAGLLMAAGPMSMLGGCTTASPEALAANDPYEQANRAALKRNAFIDHYFVIPTVGVYFLLVPEDGRRACIISWPTWRYPPSLQMTCCRAKSRAPAKAPGGW
jgi:hypothetical protein